ncbi:MAG: hypothetical protein QNJ22_19415 [Desulfosarcinaceae bacterium]|nr:hypothetical protein [Desulfosarcinaceae bacterium]
MKWMEVIGVRTAVSNRASLEAKLKELMDAVQLEEPTRSIKLLQRASIATDLCVHLQHDTPLADATGSRLGLRLAAEMRAFGLVHHSVWSELGNGHK